MWQINAALLVSLLGSSLTVAAPTVDSNNGATNMAGLEPVSSLELPSNASACPNNVEVVQLKNDKDVYPAEAAWLEGRKGAVADAWSGYVEKHGLDSKLYAEAPRVGIAISGGGYRAMLHGAGVLKALDSRSSELGSAGLLDITTYTAGSSGGALALGSIYYHGFPMIDEWVGKLRLADHMFAPGYGEGGMAAVKANYQVIKDYVAGKKDAGFPTGMIDYWAGLGAHAILDNTSEALSFQLSDLAESPKLKNHSVPLPMFMALEVKSNEANLMNNSNAFEWGVFSSGGYDLPGMVPTSVVGTQMDKGAPVHESGCVSGLDTLQYALGTSSAIWAANGSAPARPANATNSTQARRSLLDMLASLKPGTLAGDIYFDLQEAGIPITDLFSILGTFIPLMAKPSADNGYRSFEPAVVANPFKGMPNDDGLETEENIYLGDGGLSGLGLPLQPLFVPAREVDVVIAIDAIGDRVIENRNGTKAFVPGGQTIYRQAEYMKLRGWAFPEVPTKEQFAECNNALMERITFFGCARNDTPVIVYVPNRLLLDVNTGFRTLKLQYSAENVTNTVENGYRQFADESANTCIACLLASRNNPSAPASETCQQCLVDYCWTAESPLKSQTECLNQNTIGSTGGKSR